MSYGDPDPLRVLVVDDNVDAADTLAELVAGIGCRTAVAYEAPTAVRVAQLFQPHLVFLDLNLPAEDGCDVLDRMRGLSAMPSCALYVCLTGSQRPDDEARCEAAGFDVFVRKPITVEQIETLLGRVKLRLRGSRAA